MSKMKLKRPKKTPKECNYNFNGERKSGNTDEECAKLKQQYDKIVEKKKKEMEALKDNDMEMGTNRTTMRADDFQEKKKKDNAFRDSNNDGNVASRFFERLKARKKSKRERRNSLNPMD